MSYYVRVGLNVHNMPESMITELQAAIAENEELTYVFTDKPEAWLYYDIIMVESYELVNHGIDDDAKRWLSLRFPDALFEYNCRGEDDEEWREFWKDGKCATYSPTIIWPEFNPADLS